MRDMFYNYEYNINKKEYPCPDCITEPCEPKLGCNEVRILTNLKGQEMGVKVRQNARFNLYFSLCGIEEISEDRLKDAEFYFEILDFGGRKIYESDVEFVPGHACVEVVTDDSTKLKYGNYRMHLYMILEDIKYTIFAPTDGILSVE